VNWPEQIRIRNIMKRQSDELAERRGPVAAAPVHDYVRAQDLQFAEAQRVAMEREQRATREHQARQKAMADSAQAAQRLWAERRGELRSVVIEAEQAVAACERRIDGADLEDASKAASELVVRQRRLENARAAYATHASRSPL
jgi:hypothetical protein